MARGGSKPGSAPRKVAKVPGIAAGTAQEGATGHREERTIPFEIRQRCLDIFRDRLEPTTDDASTLQEVKGHLFNRDFSTAFGKEEYLRVYASRWSPSRALAYLQIFMDLAPDFGRPRDDESAVELNSDMKVVCLGGGAGGELVGLGAWLNMLSEGGSIIDRRYEACHIDLLDVADWHAIIEKLQTGLISPPELSKYASRAKKDANKALVPASVLHAKFHQFDVLSPNVAKQDGLAKLVEEADLATFMFTLNELYHTSLPATQALLNRIMTNMKVGSHLLVVDSPGSYSTVSLNGAEKKYPMQWLLDHTLLSSKAGGESEHTRWEKVVEDDSRWFRLNKELRYPIALEDMRFQLHLFRRLR